jgi:UDP-3-O-[3-hydroxymyristoyl] glucosamine N-acyltransferase
VYFARAAQYFESLTAIVPAAGIHASAVVADSAQVAPRPHRPARVIEDGAVIGDGA